MAGTVDIIQRCHTGLEMRDEVLWFNPCLPEEVSRLQFRLHYRGHWLNVAVTHAELTVAFEGGWSASVQIGLNGEVHTFEQGQERCFRLGSSC
jgi:alpha,alpha-trehalase